MQGIRVGERAPRSTGCVKNGSRWGSLDGIEGAAPVTDGNRHRVGRGMGVAAHRRLPRD